jgi:hypothetical protein
MTLQTDRERDQELDGVSFESELDALVPAAWDNPLGLEERDLISFDEFFHDVESVSEPIPESCRTDPLQEAAAELALAQKRLDGHFTRFLQSLTDREVDCLNPHDQEVVRTFRALPEPEQEALLDRFSLRAVPRSGEAPRRRPYAPPALEASRPLSAEERARKTTALRTIARQNLGTIVTFERMLGDVHGLRLVEPESPGAFEPSSDGAGERSSLGAAEPSSLRADEPPSVCALGTFEPKVAPPWGMEECTRGSVGTASAGARSCRWCRERVHDEFDHDFCEGQVPDEQLTHPELGGEYRPTELRWKEDVTCACCDSKVAVELVAPPAAAERGMVTAATVPCSCGTHISVAYSWRRRRVVGLRMRPPTAASPSPDAGTARRRD